MRIRARLARLERTAGGAGCPACRDRRGLAVQGTGCELPDGTVRFEQPEPAPCPRCGEVAEVVVEVLEVVVATREEAQRLAAEPRGGDTAQRPRAGRGVPE